MENPADIRASLTICIQTQDLLKYKNILKQTSIDLSLLRGNDGFSIFHEIASALGKENILIEYLSALKEEFQLRYPETWRERIKNMINTLVGREKNNALMIAIKHNKKVIHRKSMVKDFVFLGADLNTKNIYGQGPLHLAASFGIESIIVYLCKELDVSFNVTDSNGRTPLHLAALENQTNAGILLIAWCEDLNLVDIEGFTPLHLAALSQNYKIARNLILRGAKIDIVDIKGDTALNIAINRGASSIVNLLVIYI